MIKKIFSIIFYIIAVLLVGVYFGTELIPNFSLSEYGRLVLLCGSCLFLYFGGLLMSKYLKNNKPMRINLWIFFILYLLLLITLTLFDPMWGRNGFTFVNWFSTDFSIYLKQSVNLIPFNTILAYIDIFDSVISTHNIILNLLGNLFALMPMAFFLPLLFKKQNKVKTFIITVIVFILGIEISQLLTASGRCDIDDVILNTVGAVIMYFILRINSFKKIIGNIFLLEQNKITKKDIIKVFLIIFISITLVVGIVKYRNYLYEQNIERREAQQPIVIEIVDESKVCADELEKFYEDDFYKYYYPCIKSDDVYAIINYEEKYLVKDLLHNNPTEYDITINKIIKRFDIYEIDYIKENKYEFISFNIKIPEENSSLAHPKEVITIEDESILEVAFDYSSDQIKPERNYLIDLHLMPKRAGKTNLTIEFIDGDINETIIIYNYLVEIDENLNVTFKTI